MSATWRGSDAELDEITFARAVDAYRRHCPDITDDEVRAIAVLVAADWKNRGGQGGLKLTLAAYRAGIEHGRYLEQLNESSRRAALAENPDQS